MSYYRIQFAQAYGEGIYGDGTYSCIEGETCETTGTGGTAGGSGSNGGLADTGIAVLVFITLASLIIFVALVIRFIRRPAANPLPQEVPVEDDLPTNLPPTQAR